MSGNCGKNISGANVPCGARSGDFAIGMHEAAVADGRENSRERNFRTQDRGAKVALVDLHSMPWTKCDVLKGSAIFAKCDLSFSATVQIIEDRLWNAPFGHAAQVGDIHYPRWREFFHLCQKNH